ncbi:hypothetical protein EVAR_62381_1 [Eumeta japonica]|uniref:Uncharacterized protein n=1 Tax=Eumeta variegata TaxID=151549 RepID=A0A4C1YWM5_EUMVA|nr:hypothetical protein EVAR_62381_1 [Eumeta japonica]
MPSGYFIFRILPARAAVRGPPPTLSLSGRRRCWMPSPVPRHVAAVCTTAEPKAVAHQGRSASPAAAAWPDAQAALSCRALSPARPCRLRARPEHERRFTLIIISSASSMARIHMYI